MPQTNVEDRGLRHPFRAQPESRDGLVELLEPSLADGEVDVARRGFGDEVEEPGIGVAGLRVAALKLEALGDLGEPQAIELVLGIGQRLQAAAGRFFRGQLSKGLDSGERFPYTQESRLSRRDKNPPLSHV